MVMIDPDVRIRQLEADVRALQVLLNQHIGNQRAAHSTNNPHPQLSMVSRGLWTPTNVTTDRSYNADTVVVAELADIVGTIIADMQSVGLFG